MKRWLWLLPLLLAAFLPSGGTDIGKLQPVQVVCLTRENGAMVIRTDTGDQGMGIDLPSAVEDLKGCAPGEIFMETADHLLLMPDCLPMVEELAQLLRPSCTICLMEGEPNLDEVGDFLSLHGAGPTLMEYRAGWGELQTLKTVDGRMCLVP